MDVKDAVKLAKQYVIDLFAEEGIADIGLEEVKFDDLTRNWSITIGFSRSWDKPQNSFAALAGHMYPRRSYKVVMISDDNAKVISVKNHEVES
ncbi:MAG TPA: hypothetical protein PLJ25_03825 [Methanothrix sp.]|nr:hypothetical protein [Methanothrix sp.]